VLEKNKNVADFHLCRIIGGFVGTLNVLVGHEGQGGETPDYVSVTYLKAM